nr:YqzM family protein [Halobacillus sp. Nhm2S1]
MVKNGLYLIIDIGGVTVNEFKNDIQSKTNDVIDSGLGFVFSFVFFFVIFFIGVLFSFLGQ